MPSTRMYLVQRYRRALQFGDMELTSGNIENVTEKSDGTLVLEYKECHEGQAFVAVISGSITIPHDKNKDKTLNVIKGNEINILRENNTNDVMVYVSSTRVL